VTCDARRVAVVGAGVSGLTAAYLLRHSHDVTLFEADARLGGHAHTHDLVDSQGRAQSVDSGFIVHNDRTYPFLRRLFTELDIEVRPTEMSMSISCQECGLEYAGGRGLRGVLAQRRRTLDARFGAMLVAVKRFQRAAGSFLSRSAGDDLTSYGEFLRLHRFSPYFVTHYAIPLVACVWSSGHETATRYPARYLFEFLRHHGMLQLSGSPTWYTVVGGSGQYVARIRDSLPAVREATAVRAITRKPDGVELHDGRGQLHTVDRVIIATHADQALALLTDPTDLEAGVLSAFDYSANATVLHTDVSLLPRARQARASWNYAMRSCSERGNRPVVSYWMNRLQGLAASDDYVVTLNASERVDPDRVLAEMTYTHPIYTAESVSAQHYLPQLNTGQTVFAGAYHGWGFHEDGCRSGVAAARACGVSW
jgi:predicted NAD/FAD-binding protein